MAIALTLFSLFADRYCLTHVNAQFDRVIHVHIFASYRVSSFVLFGIHNEFFVLSNALLLVIDDKVIHQATINRFEFKQ